MKIQWKLWAQLTFAALLTSTLFNACTKQAEETTPPPPARSDATAAKTAVTTFELVSLKSQKTLSSSYNAQFGKESVKLYKASDSTLTFVIPDVAAGEYLLDFELAEIKFQVTQTAVADPAQLIATVLKTFDTELEALDPKTPEQAADLDSMKLDKIQMARYLDALPAAEKRQAVLFYEANKDLFKPFINGVKTRLDTDLTFSTQQNSPGNGPVSNLKKANNGLAQPFASSIKPGQNTTTTFSPQQECPRTNYKAFYTCTANNLSALARELYVTLEKASTLFGTQSNGYVGGMYLLMISAQHPIAAFRNTATAFLHSKWVFSNKLFHSASYNFTDDDFNSLNLDANFRTLDSYEDQYLSPETSLFFSAWKNLHIYWDEFKFLGPFPKEQVGAVPAILEAGDITITKITNPRVFVKDQAGQHVKFKSITGTEETFKYTLTVKKQGFEHSKELSATLKAFDSTAFYRNAVIGTWIHTGSGGQIDEYKIEAGGYGYRSSTTNTQGVRTDIKPYDYYNIVSWSLIRKADGYHFGIAYENRNLGLGWKITYPFLQFTSPSGLIKKQ